LRGVLSESLFLHFQDEMVGCLSGTKLEDKKITKIVRTLEVLDFSFKKLRGVWDLKKKLPVY
jgi:hypothetical protein